MSNSNFEKFEISNRESIQGEAIPIHLYADAAGGAHKHENPLNHEIMPSAPTFQLSDGAQRDGYVIVGEEDVLLQPQTGSVQSISEQDLLLLQARANSLKADNLIAEQNMKIKYYDGDARMRIGATDCDPEEKWKEKKKLQDSIIAKESDGSHFRLPTDFDSKYDVEGPSPLDTVPVTETNYTIPKDHGIGKEYVFGEGMKYETYKSVFDK
jgi:hypothetical protein